MSLDDHLDVSGRVRPVLIGDKIAGSAFDELAEHRIVDPLDRIRLDLVGEARADGLVDCARINCPTPTPAERRQVQPRQRCH